MFQVNDIVLYGTNGVCRLEGIDERDCSGRMVQYYILKPIHTAKATVFVPVNNEKLTSRMRYVLTKEEIDKTLPLIQENSHSWMSDEQQRKERFRDLACRADTFELICLIQTLVEHQKTVAARGKKLHVADERMLQEAEKLVCDEFSYVLGIPKEEVPSYITEGMKERVH